MTRLVPALLTALACAGSSDKPDPAPHDSGGGGVSVDSESADDTESGADDTGDDTGGGDDTSGGDDTGGGDDTSGGGDTADTAEPATCIDEAEPLVWPVDFSTVGIYGWGGDGVGYGVDVNYTKVITAGTALSSSLVNVPILYPFSGDDLDRATANIDAMLSVWDLDDVSYLILSEEHTAYEADVLTGAYDHIKAAWPDAPPVLQWMSPPNYEPYTAIPADGWVLDSYGVDGDTYRRWVMKHVVTGGRVLLCIWASEGSGSYGDFDVMSPSSDDQVAIAREFNLPMFFFAVDWDGGSVLAWWGSDDEDTTKWRAWYEEVRDEANATDATTLPEATANDSAADPREISPDEAGAYSFYEPFSTADFIDDATLTGFLNLRWDADAGQLYVEPKPGLANQSCTSSLRWGFTSETDITELALSLSGTLSGDVSVTLGLSVDGVTWTEETATGDGAFSLSVAGPDEAVTRLYARVTATVPPDGDDHVALDTFSVTAEIAEPEPGITIEVLEETGSWTEDFTSQAYLYEAEVTNPDTLVWEEAEYVYISSVWYASASSELLYTVTTDSPVTEITAGYADGYANWSSWASYNTVTITDTASGSTATDSTTNYESYTDVNDNYWGPISATLSVPDGTTSFTVHYGMYSNSGYEKNYTNELDDLVIAVKR